MMSGRIVYLSLRNGQGELVDVLSMGDSADAKVQRYCKALLDGTMTVNDVRREEGLPPLSPDYDGLTVCLEEEQ